jgi:TPR repeat protein
MACFLSIYEKDKNRLAKVEVYTQIGLMYEIGLGVQQNMKKAMQWYNLAGLI